MDDIRLFETMIGALKKSALRITTQRREILRYIIENKAHFDAELILSDLTRNGITVSRATIYRTLDVLSQNVLVDKYDFGDGKARYEIKTGQSHHDHLVCIRCGRIVEFNNETSIPEAKQICSRNHFKYFNHYLHVYGLCPGCQKLQGENPSQNH